MVGYLEETVKTIEYPDHREADVAPVVEFAGETDQLVTAFPQRSDPPGWRGKWR